MSNPQFFKVGHGGGRFVAAQWYCGDLIFFACRKSHAETYVPSQHQYDKLMMKDMHMPKLAKYAADTMLVIRISFMNELANVAELLGIDIENVLRDITSDNRMG